MHGSIIHTLDYFVLILTLMSLHNQAWCKWWLVFEVYNLLMSLILLIEVVTQEGW